MFDFSLMARRKKATRRRRPKTISALNVLESYSYAAILSRGLANNTPIGLLTGKTDLSGDLTPIYNDDIIGNFGYAGSDVLSLGDMITQPTAALATVQQNFMSNYQGMIISSAITRFGFKFAKRALRVPIANVNRNIMKNLGLGVRI